MDGPPNVELRRIEVTDALYSQETHLRWVRLRQPLGYPPGSERFEFEDDALHFVAVYAGQCVGCVLFMRQGVDHGRLFQMAVDEAFAGRGLGRRLVRHLEEHVAPLGVRRIELHARCHVQGFYERLGYTPSSEVYEEVGIPHVTMERIIS